MLVTRPTPNGVSEIERVIQTRGLRRRFGDNVVLDGLDLEVRRGEVFGFLGPNGSGKTTTIRLLLGLLRPDEGEIELFGQTVNSQRPAILARVGAMVEAPAFYPYLSGRDNLRVLARMSHLPETRVDEVLELAGLGRGASRKFGDYSVGMRQRLGFASTLLRDPDLLILDEPTTGLDPDGQRDFRDLMPRLKDRGKTVFLSSHSLNEVAEVCTRVVILKHGRRAAAGGVDWLLRSEPIVEVRTAEPAAAIAALEQQPWIRSVERDGEWLIVSVGDGAANEVNAALVAAGVIAHEVRMRERSLENLYHEVVHGEAA